MVWIFFGVLRLNDVSAYNTVACSCNDLHRHRRDLGRHPLSRNSDTQVRLVSEVSKPSKSDLYFL